MCLQQQKISLVKKNDLNYSLAIENKIRLQIGREGSNLQMCCVFSCLCLLMCLCIFECMCMIGETQMQRVM